MPAIVNDAEFQGSFFGLEVKGMELSVFTGCSGLSMEFDVIEHKMMSKNGKQLLQKIPGTWAKYGEVTMKRGLTKNLEIHNWYLDVLNGKIGDARKEASIVIYNQKMTEVARFNLTHVWPSKISVGDLSASATEVLIEEFTLVYEHLDWA